MKLELEKMRIENFKGCKNLEIDFSSTLTKIFGMNGTGKTTIPDAFSWVLFNKDSHGNAPGSDAFREKPLDADGKECHNVDTTVELICKLDGQPFDLRRTQKENWVKKRGSSSPAYQGNVSTYWINDVETKQTDFKARIAQITSEDVFRLIASLSALNAMDWKKRREQLLALSDEDVDGMLLQRGEYRPLADECAQRSVGVEDLRKIFADQRKRLNEQLKMLPVRIDEAKKALPAFKKNEVADAEYIIKDAENDIAKIDGLIGEIKSADASASNAKAIRALETELESLKRCVDNAFYDQIRALSADYDAVQKDVAINAKRFQAASAEKQAMEERIKSEMAQRDILRNEYSTEFQSKFTPPSEDSDVCPTCGQPWPESFLQEREEAAKATWNEKHMQALQKIRTAGQEIAEAIKSHEAQLSELDNNCASALCELNGAKDHLNAAAEELALAKQKSPDYSTEPRIADLQQQLDGMREREHSSPDERLEQLLARKKELQESYARHYKILLARDQAVETEARIRELEGQLKDAGNKITEVEQLIERIEQFVTERCSALEESINSKFQTVRWKLFDVQINGGIVDTCQAMLSCPDGYVPYESANTAAQINADIEIVNALSKHYDLSLPLFVDNSERVNCLADTDAQLITLAVSTDSQLRIEKEA